MHPLTAVFDLDGTLAEYDGWKGEEHIGPPIKGMVQCLRQLVGEGWTLWVYSVRKRHEVIEKWLADHHFPPEVRVWKDSGKPPAHVYVDDRAVKFRNAMQVLVDLKIVQQRGGEGF